MSINHYCAKTSSSNHKTFFSSHIIPNSTANTSRFWASSATAAATGAMFCSQSAAFGFNLYNEGGEELLEEQEREANSSSPQVEQVKLFEKPLTPSDVGKLNRLVIPKQHAEKYFPLNGGGDSGEKGLLLGFEDEVGKPWRFRYSYWNSSQSYVLTKGWSRFVKEKRLDAGDIVLFARHRNDVGRLFIGWRRRNSGGGQVSGAAQPLLGGSSGGWSGVLYPGHPYPSQHQGSSSVVYQTDCSNAENQTRPRSGNSRRLRLFGVNLEWVEDDSEPSTPEGSATSSQGRTDQQPYHQY